MGNTISQRHLQITTTLEPNWGGEASGYLRYIIEHYTHLPDLLLFVHGNPLIHNPYFLSWFECFNPYYHGYFNINTLYVVQRILDEDIFQQFFTTVNYAWKANSIDYTLPRIHGLKFNIYCCGQFFISKQMILQYPIKFYQILLENVMEIGFQTNEGKDKEKDNNKEKPNNRIGAVILEHIWHIIYGENLHTQQKTYNDYCHENNLTINIPKYTKLRKKNQQQQPAYVTESRPFLSQCNHGPCASITKTLTFSPELYSDLPN